MDPYLDPRTTRFQKRIRTLGGFAARTQKGYYGWGKQVSVATVRLALTAISLTIKMDTGTNPVKLVGSNSFLLPLQLMLKGWSKEDPPKKKKLPVEADIPEFMARMGRQRNATD